MSYRQFKVVEKDGEVTATEPIRPERIPAWARNVSQEAHDWSGGPDMTKPHFKAPIPFVLPPADKAEPFYPHNHQPSITWCPNGDLLAIWYSTGKEQGTELTVLASRLRLGADAWEPSSEFFKATNRNMHGSSIYHDGKGTIYHFNGMAPDGGKGWAKLALLMRTSRDNGVTWTAPRAIGARQTGRHQVISGTLMTSGGVLIQNCDAVSGGSGGTALHISHDGGKSWSDPGEGKPKPNFAEGGKGEGTIAGIHAKVVELRDGRLLAFGRGDTINGRMPMSVSSDLGKTWSYHASPFPPIGGGQRLVLKRLQEGALLFVSFTSGNRKKPEANGMTFTDQAGKEFTGHGMFAAVSFDDGKTWPVRKLLTPGEGKFNGGAWTGDFTATPTRAEHAGYLAAIQTPDGMIHLISSGLHYRFNLAWLSSSTNDMIAKTLITSEAEEERLSRLETKGLVTIKPVALPAGRYLKGDNLHLGWPVGIKVGQTLLCAYHQTRYHHSHRGGPRTDAQSSEAVVVRSTDGGNTWSDPMDIRQFGTNSKAMVLNFGNCFGVLNKKAFLATRYGLYRSEDEGKTWALLPDALTQEQTGHKYKDNFGPRMIVHPDKGLVVAVGVEGSPCIDMYSSTDEGVTWRHERHQLSNTIHPLEPTALYHDGHFIFLTRNHTLPFRWHQQLGETQRPAMMVSDTGWFPMTHQKLANTASYRWPDTTDVDFNPVTTRFEAVVTNRSGGVGENEKNERNEQTVNLWSISKEEMYAGRADKWRFEGTLLRFKSGMLNISPDDVDAAHPGGAVIDEDNGVQHIFIYCGRYSTPSGIYRITRTLDTDKLRDTMRQQCAEATNSESAGGRAD